MKTFLVLQKEEHDRPEGPERDTFPQAMVEAFLKRYTVSGELVLDPFAGFGTTLRVAEAMGRRSVGIEWHEDRASFIAERIGPLANVIRGDTRNVDQLGLEPADFLITSPPYMCRGDTEDPLQGYSVPGNGYESYLAGLQDIFRRLTTVMKPDAVMVVNVSNIKRWDGLTTLAWDVARVLSEVVTFEQEIVICWGDSDHAFQYDHEYCLIFRNVVPPGVNPGGGR